MRAAAGSTLTLALARGAAQDEIDQRAIVDDRGGVGHQHEAGDAAGGRGIGGGGEGLAVFVAGLAGEDAHVDEAGGDDQAAWRRSDLGAVRHALRRPLADAGDPAVLDQHGAGSVAAAWPDR